MDEIYAITFYNFIFLRRVNLAMKTCGEVGTLSPNKIYCALAITSPRTKGIFTPEEKQIYLSAIILSDGFYYG